MVRLLRLFLILLSLLFGYEVITCSSLSHPSLSTSNVHHICIRKEKDALLQFKRSFVVLKTNDGSCSFTTNSNANIQSWNEEVHTAVNSSAGDCCSWQGVECDVSTGHVIGLDLRCSQLYGAIASDSTLFHLSHLRKLDLSFNNFNGSSISPAFGRNFPYLTNLDLSYSSFSGVIPPEIAHLSKLISLTIYSSYEDDPLRMEPQAFKDFIENQTQLESLQLHGINISSSIPEYFGNLSSLGEIGLSENGLYGELPLSIFQLPYLEQLNLYGNDGLVGYLPKSNWSCSTHLVYLDLSGVGFSSELPDSCSPGCLKSIWYLDLNHGGFFGSIPPWLGNHTEIQVLVLSSNSFTGLLPFTLSNLRNTIQLDLGENNLEGEIHDAFFGQLNKLVYLNLKSNSFHGKFTYCLANLTELGYLDLSNNYLTGPLPSNISEIKKLGTLSLSNNNLSGTMEPLSFGKLKELDYVDLSHNSLQGTLPLIPHSLSYLLISNNIFHGYVPPSICDSSMLQVLDLSHNNLSGMVPKCISNFSKGLSVLNLGTNNFHGTIPLNFAKGNRIRSINLNSNNFEGQVPRSLANCRELEVLDLGNNKVNDVFPHWLNSLPELQVLVLRHNMFQGVVGLSRIEKVPSFTKLRIFDLSHNVFVGPLPTNYFLNLDAMRNVNHIQSTTLEYMGESYYHDTVVITLKGFDFEIQRILKVLATIDFSGNRFGGEIPIDIGGLIGIQSLNLSSNILTGHIPSSLANLRVLESLDLSSNQLSGPIPHELTHITTLEVLNLSSNHLTGPIPQGFQFNTFQNDSYSGNLGLCGPPLSKKCSDNGIPHDQPSLAEDDDEGGIFDGFGWKVVLLGYGCGTVFGLGVGFVMFSTGKPKRLVTFVEEELMRITKGTGKRHAQGNRNAWSLETKLENP